MRDQSTRWWKDALGITLYSQHFEADWRLGHDNGLIIESSLRRSGKLIGLSNRLNLCLAADFHLLHQSAPFDYVIMDNVLVGYRPLVYFGTRKVCCTPLLLSNLIYDEYKLQL